MRNPFQLPEAIPAALPWRKWKVWGAEMKKKYPVRFFLSRALPRWWARATRVLWETPWYWLRTHTYNRYHILDLRNKVDGYDWGWIDADAQILYACFNILVSFVEKESPTVGNHKTPEEWMSPDHEWQEGEREHLQEQIDKELEIRAIYDWWKTERKKAKDDSEKESTTIAMFEKREAFDAKDEEMLIRLMKVRRSLWT